ncbi:MAG: LysR family transcriptional regulator [Myxococcales bacterium]|nr:LysR family transcriptional regulator [Myxococcales bacterium]
MRWDDAQLLREIGRAGGLVGAAEALGVDHSTVYRRLRALEDAVGARLFARAGGRYHPTPLGEEVLAHAEAMAARMCELEDALLEVGGEPAGEVRLTAPEALLPLLGPLLADFARAYPAVQVQSTFADRALELGTRQAEVALRFADDPPPDAVGRRLATVAWAVYAPADCPRPDALAWAGFTRDLGHLGAARWLRQQGVAPVMTVNTVPALERVLCAGDWRGPLPCFLGDANPRLLRQGPPLEAAATALWLLYHQALWQSRRVRALVEHLEAGLGGQAAAFEGAG